MSQCLRAAAVACRLCRTSLSWPLRKYLYMCVCVCVDPKMTTQKEAHRRQLTTATSTARAAGQVNTKGPVLYYLCREYIYYAYIKYTTFKVRTCQELTQ